MEKDTRGRSLVAAFLFGDDGTLLPVEERPTKAEIAGAIGYSRRQVAARIDALREEGVLSPEPEKEEEFIARSKAQKGHPSYPLSPEGLIVVREKMYRRPLTDREKQQTILLAKARQVPGGRSKLSVHDFYQTHERKLARTGPRRTFLEIFYAARICLDEPKAIDNQENRPSVALEDAIEIYQQIDPQSFGRWRKDLEFLELSQLVDYVRMRQDKQRQVLVAICGGQSLVPQSATDRKFLLRYHREQQKKQETGNGKGVDMLLQSAWKQDKWIFERLYHQMLAIWRLTLQEHTIFQRDQK